MKSSRTLFATLALPCAVAATAAIGCVIDNATTEIGSSDQAVNSATATPVNPDAYSCDAPGYIDFEIFADGTNLSSGAILGVHFTTTGGYTWSVGDFATGNYNGKYPNGIYTSQGTRWAWLGVNQGSGRIDFVYGPASRFSLLTSCYTGVSLDAYGKGGNLLATAGPCGANTSTGTMCELAITRDTRDIAFVIVHDSGNYFLVDAVCTNAQGVSYNGLCGNGALDNYDDPPYHEECDDGALNGVPGNPCSADCTLHWCGDGTTDPGEECDQGVANSPSGTCSPECEILNSPPTVSTDNASGIEGSAIALAATATDPDGDPLTVSWTYTAYNDVDSGASCTFSDPTAASTTLTCDDDGTFAVAVTVCDGITAPVSASATVTVANAAPEITDLTPADGALYALGEVVTVAATVADPGGNDSHDCAFAWDDGSADDLAGVTGGTCTFDHVFAAAGVYSILVTATDDDGGEASATAMVIVYDPSAGFVTGGGWIDSPPGALVAAPDLTGKAVFGFVSKYKKGATVPTGQTQFQFQVADFSFHSASYEWLVIAGARAQYKGIGTLNGIDGYRFLLTAVDGEMPGGGGVDRFRIKITKDDELVYDNAAGAEDIDGSPTQALGGGSIVIHKK